MPEGERSQLNSWADKLISALDHALDVEMFDNDGDVIGFRRSDSLSGAELAIVYWHLRTHGVADEDISNEHRPEGFEREEA